MHAPSESDDRPAARSTRWFLGLFALLLIVIARSLVYILFPHATFDSDQAIVGLMAKHLAEGRAFPLYLYGYSYMLGVEAWLAVPYFWIAGPTVAALHASTTATNLVIVTLLYVGLTRHGGLGPGAACIASLFFAAVPPDTAANLVDAGGGSIEQFAWVLILWWVRNRPFAFGALLAVGFLNREFTIYAVPVLLLGQLWQRTLFRADTARAWFLAAVTFFAVWQSIEGMKSFSDPMGPGTRGRATASSQADNLAGRVHIDLVAAPAGAVTLLNGAVRDLLGGRPVSHLGTQGRTWVGVALGLLAGLAICRVVWLVRRRSVHLQSTAFGWYVLGIGAMTVAGYALTRPTDIVTARYLLMSLYLPVGLSAVWLALEPIRVCRIALSTAILVWAGLASMDNFLQYERFASGREPDGIAEIIEELDRRGITLAEAGHWRAYKITFRARERIIVASSDVVRIQQYRDLANAAGARLVRLQQVPCGESPGEPVGGLYICEPADDERTAQ